MSWDELFHHSQQWLAPSKMVLTQAAASGVILGAAGAYEGAYQSHHALGKFVLRYVKHIPVTCPNFIASHMTVGVIGGVVGGLACLLLAAVAFTAEVGYATYRKHKERQA